MTALTRPPGSVVFSVMERGGWWVPVIKHASGPPAALARQVGLLEASAFVTHIHPHAHWLEPKVFAARFMYEGAWR